MSIVRDPQSIAIESDEGRRFLRRVVSPRRRLKDRWSIVASSDENWTVRFECERYSRRTRAWVKAEVATDITVTLTGETGERVRGDGDHERSVFVPQARRLRLDSWETAIAARLLRDGWRLCIRHHVGSPRSANLGLAFVECVARPPLDWQTVGDVVIGHTTIFQNGSVLVQGGVS